MKKKIILGVSITTILGIGGYFAYQWFNNRPRGGEGGGETDSNNTTDEVINPPNSPNSSSGSDRPDDVLVFQQWANSNGYTPKLEEDGLWGPNTKAAWDAKKSQYNTSTNTAATVNELTGQLKAIYDSFMRSDDLKGVTKAYKNSATGKMNVETIGNKSGKKYIYVAGGSMYVYGKDGTQIAAGNYSNNGLKLVVTLGPASGKTFTGTSILKVANQASNNPQFEQTLSNSEVADIVAKMYYAMKGVGTYPITFVNQWKRMNTTADWNAVYSTFGKKDGYNLWQWMKGESDLMIYSRKRYFNDWFKSRGSSNKF
tara:strand:+ start:300 stop:1238 length:939 start_codon:yes stop_codon:yes gene_type:complete